MILTFGSLNADLFFEMEKAPAPGQTLLASAFHMEAGGKGANQALAAARDGATVVMVGAVGHDALASVALGNLEAGNVDISRVARCDAPTGCASIIVAANGQNQIAVALGANADARQAQIDDDLLHEADILLLQMESDRTEIETLIGRAHEAGVSTILNLAPAIELDSATLQKCTYIVVNEDEAEMLAGWIGCEPTANALSRTLGTGVIRTLGADGAEAAVAGGYHRVEAHAIDPIDTTAAGDCFIGVLGSGLEQGLDIERAMQRATAASALTCLSKGSQSSLPWKIRTDEFLRE